MEGCKSQLWGLYTPLNGAKYKQKKVTIMQEYQEMDTDVQYPIFRFDPVSRISWLEFDGKPDQDTITLLKRDGWRWAGYRKQWHPNRRYAKPPVGIDYSDGGECDYSKERSERLSNASERAGDRSQEAYERSNALVENIPFGQPVLIGHHSQRSHEKTLEKSRSAMDTSVKEGKLAEHLEYKAKSSARHQAYKEKPDVIARRIKRLKGEITTQNNNFAHEVQWIAWEVKDGKYSMEEGKAKVKASKASTDARIALIETEIKENEEALQEAGGLIADKIVIEVGDVIMGRWQGRSKVIKINKRQGVITSYTCEPMGRDRSYCSKRIIPITDVRGLVEKADGTDPNKPEQEAPLPMPELGEETVTRSTVAKEQQPEREFKVASVQTLEIYDNRTSIFPTPHAIGVQMARELPTDVKLILEPSAGTGALAIATWNVLSWRDEQHSKTDIHCCEIVPQLNHSLKEQGFQVVGENFLEYKPGFLYDAIIGNPPYKNAEWMKHVKHMLELLKPGGFLSLVLPGGFLFRNDSGIAEFRELVKDHGVWEQLPEDTFKEEGTNVNTVLVTLVKPE